MKRKTKQKPYDYSIMIMPVIVILVVGFLSIFLEKRMCRNLSYRIGNTQSRMKYLENTLRPTEYRRVIIYPNTPTPTPSPSPSPTLAPTPIAPRGVVPSGKVGEPVLY